MWMALLQPAILTPIINHQSAIINA